MKTSATNLIGKKVDKLGDLLEFVRWKDWGAGKLPLLLGVCFYIGLAEQKSVPSYLLDCVLFALFASASSTYGYLVNDLGDVAIDQQQGKHNTFTNWPRQRAIWLLLGLTALAVGLALTFVERPWFLALWLIWLASSTAYSLPPLRLKERGSMGLLAPAVAQQTLPVLIAFAAFGRLVWYDVLIWTIYVFFKGMSLILLHQLLDLEADRLTQTQTFAVRRGYRAVSLAAFAALELEKACLWGPLFLTVLVAPTWHLGRQAINPALFLLLLYLPIYVVSLVESWLAVRRGRVRDPYHGPIRGATGIACVALPVIILPFFLLGLLATIYPPASLMLVAFAVFHAPYVSKAFRRLRCVRRAFRLEQL